MAFNKKEYMKRYMQNRRAWLKFKGGEKYESYKARRREYSKNYTATKKESRNRKKIELVKMFGGKCQRCGYDKCIRALAFHHKDATQKEFTLANQSGRTIEKLTKEAEKCILLCANCHFELHMGL